MWVVTCWVWHDGCAAQVCQYWAEKSPFSLDRRAEKTETELEAESTEVPMARDLFKHEPRARNLLKLKLDCLVEENATAGLIRRDGNISRTLR